LLAGVKRESLSRREPEPDSNKLDGARRELVTAQPSPGETTPLLLLHFGVKLNGGMVGRLILLQSAEPMVGVTG
jgi:hypothetical protein